MRVTRQLLIQRTRMYFMFCVERQCLEILGGSRDVWISRQNTRDCCSSLSETDSHHCFFYPRPLHNLYRKFIIVVMAMKAPVCLLPEGAFFEEMLPWVVSGGRNKHLNGCLNKNITSETLTCLPNNLVYLCLQWVVLTFLLQSYIEDRIAKKFILIDTFDYNFKEKN